MPRRFAPLFKVLELESRMNPVVTASFASNVLTVIGDSTANDIAVIVQNNQVLVTEAGGTVSITPATPAAAEVFRVEVYGNDGADRLDLGRVFLGEFAFQSAFNGGNLLRPVLLNGGNGNNVILGAPNVGNQIVVGNGDNDIQGGAVSDFIVGGDGHDQIHGGAGDDQIEGGAGDDQLFGGDGNDMIDGGAGKDSVQGNAGNDVIVGEVGDPTLDSGGQAADFVKVSKTVANAQPLILQIDVATNQLTINPGSPAATELPSQSNVFLDDESGDNQNAVIDGENDANGASVQFRVFDLNDPGIAANLPNPAFQAGMARLHLAFLEYSPQQRWQLFFNLFPALEVEGGNGPDNVVAEPLQIPVKVHGNGGNDALTVFTDGLPATESTGKVLVENRADVEFEDVEDVEVVNAPQADVMTTTLAESVDPAFVGEIVRYTLTVNNTSAEPFQIGVQAESNYPILGITSSVDASTGNQPLASFFNPLAAIFEASTDRSVELHSALTNAEVAGGASVTFTIAILANRVGMINLQTSTVPVSPTVNGKTVSKTETTEVRAGLLDRVKVVNKDFTTGDPAAGNHSLQTLASDGTMPVFLSDSKSLDPEAAPVDQPGTDTYVYLGDPVLISTGSDGKTSSNLQISGAKISRDGRFLVFNSSATNLVPGLPGNGNSQIWLRDLDAQSIRMLSFNAGGTKGGNSGSINPAVSDDGRWVAFVSAATDLVPAFVDNNQSFNNDIYLRDVIQGTTMLVTQSVLGAGGANAQASNPILSGDGRFVVFESQASNLVAGVSDNTFTTNLFVFDRLTNTTKMVDVKFDGTANGTDSVSPLRARISADGSVIVYESTSTNLIDGFVNSNNFGADIYAYFTATGKNVLVSGVDSKTSANSGAQRPNLSGDGSTVAWISAATDLVPGFTLGVNNVFIRDLRTNAVEAATVAVDGVTQSNGSVIGTIFPPELSFDGRFVSFMTAAKNLVPDYADGNTDDMELYVRDRLAKLTSLVNSQDGKTSGNRGHESTSRHFLSASGDAVVFESRASDLVTDDTNGVKDIFTVRDHVRFNFASTPATNLTLRRTGTNYEIINTATSAVLASRNAAATFEVNVTGLDGTLTIDFTSGINLVNGMTIIGDSLFSAITTVGGAFASAEHTVTGSKSGFLTYDNLTISFVNISTLNDGADVLDRTFVGLPAAEAIFVGTSGGKRQVFGGAGPTWKFNDPQASLIIDTRGGDDTITISALPSYYDSTVQFLAFGGDGHDKLDAVNAGRRVVLNGGNGNDTLLGGLGHDGLFDGPGHDTLTGNAGHDVYTLLANGSEAVNDSAGHDTLDFSLAGRPVNVSLHVLTPQVISEFNAQLTLTGQFENFTGSPLSDKITATPLALSRTIDGGSQILGDTLIVDTLGQVATQSSGKVQVAGFADILHSSVETVQVVNAGGTPPTTAIQIQNGESQRSMVRTLKVTFSEAVTFPNGLASAMVLSRNGPGSPTGIVPLQFAVNGQDVTVTFNDPTFASLAGSLNDGSYTLQLVAENILGANGPLDGDGNGTGGDSTSGGFHRLFGDSDGNATIDGSDFGQFGNAFGTSAIGSPFDFDGNGTVDGSDFAAFGARFGLTI